MVETAADPGKYHISSSAPPVLAQELASVNGELVPEVEVTAKIEFGPVTAAQTTARRSPLLGVLAVKVIAAPPVPCSRCSLPTIAIGEPDAAGVGVGVAVTVDDPIAVGVGTGVWLAVGVPAPGVALGDGEAVKLGVAVTVVVGVGPAACGIRAIRAPMLAEEVPAVAVCPPTVPAEFSSRSAIAMATPPLLALKLQRGNTGGGKVMLVALAIENSETSRSPLSPAGTTSDGVVMLVELTFP